MHKFERYVAQLASAKPERPSALGWSVTCFIIGQIVGLQHKGEKGYWVELHVKDVFKFFSKRCTSINIRNMISYWFRFASILSVSDSPFIILAFSHMICYGLQEVLDFRLVR